MCKENEDPIPDTNVGLAVIVGIVLAVTIVATLLFYIIGTRVKGDSQ